ncbi:MAG: glycosyltransferase family 39 protein [Gemmatimonadota bacterium]
MALATVLGLAVRLFLAGWSEVWLDEAYSALLAVSETGELLRHLQVDAHPPLYYLILKGWTALTSLDPLILRLPSLLFGTAAIPAVWVVASRMDQPRAGMAAAWLLALHPLHVYYSQEARSYALLSLLALGLYYALFHLLSREGRVLPAVLLGSALAYTHYFGLVFTGTTLLAAFLVMPGRRRTEIRLRAPGRPSLSASPGDFWSPAIHLGGLEGHFASTEGTGSDQWSRVECPLPPIAGSRPPPSGSGDPFLSERASVPGGA